VSGNSGSYPDRIPAGFTVGADDVSGAAVARKGPGAG
jgi:hypothetical protein